MCLKRVERLAAMSFSEQGFLKYKFLKIIFPKIMISPTGFRLGKVQPMVEKLGKYVWENFVREILIHKKLETPTRHCLCTKLALFNLLKLFGYILSIYCLLTIFCPPCSLG